MIRRWQVTLCLALAAGVPGAAVAAPAGARLVLAREGKTEYGVYVGAKPPAPVRLAAEELRRVLRVATGAEFPMREAPLSPMISLGANDAAAKAGIGAAKLPDEGFALVTRGADLYIVGKDTPDDQPALTGWARRGTLYGVYDFLERVVGVRWLMPGEVGEEIPQHRVLTVPVLDVRDGPDFPIRTLVDIQDRKRSGDKQTPDAQTWLIRQKLPPTGEGRRLQHGHAWVDYITPQVLAAHPEFIGVSADRNKFCTSNPEMVATFAKNVIAWLDAHPTQASAAISPSDGGNFCQCARCQALVVPDPHGRPSYTHVMLRFANDVARIVGRAHPQRTLGTYVYYNYMYPPEKPVPMEPNVTLVWAPLNYYGFGLMKPLYREEFPRVAAAWTKVTPHFVYHNYSNWMRSFNGAPLPPGLDILKLEIPTLKRCGAKGAEMVGVGAWGYGGPANYLLAKLLWHADSDVDALFREWLQRAYGPGWRAMERVYRLLEAGMKARKEAESPVYKGEMYEVNYAVIEQVHLPIFPEMERLYGEALAKAETDAQRRRLAMFGDNLVQLHYAMRQAGMPLPDAGKSLFYRTDEEFARFWADADFSLALYRDHGSRHNWAIWKGEWRGD